MAELTKKQIEQTYKTVYKVIFCKKCAMHFKIDKDFYHILTACPFCGNNKVE